jgi:hypothetical protein
LLPSDYNRSLDRADRSRANGDYEAAARQYNGVLACDPGNDRARAGLEKTREALASPK